MSLQPVNNVANSSAVPPIPSSTDSPPPGGGLDNSDFLKMMGTSDASNLAHAVLGSVTKDPPTPDSGTPAPSAGPQPGAHDPQPAHDPVPLIQPVIPPGDPTKTVSTPYGHLTIDTKGVSGKTVDDWSGAYTQMMNKYGKYETPEQISANQQDILTFDSKSKDSYAATAGQHTSTTPDAAPPGGTEAMGAHEFTWDLESDAYIKYVTSRFGDMTSTGGDGGKPNESWILMEDVGNYLARQALPDGADREPLSPGETQIDRAIRSKHFTVHDLARAMFGGDRASMDKVVTGMMRPPF
jgi:hypothetical protein